MFLPAPTNARFNAAPQNRHMKNKHQTTAAHPPPHRRPTPRRVHTQARLRVVFGVLNTSRCQACDLIVLQGFDQPRGLGVSSPPSRWGWPSRWGVATSHGAGTASKSFNERKREKLGRRGTRSLGSILEGEQGEVLKLEM